MSGHLQEVYDKHEKFLGWSWICGWINPCALGDLFKTPEEADQDYLDHRSENHVTG